MKKLLAVICVALFAVGCDCDCGEIVVRDHYEDRNGMKLYFIIETPCGNKQVGVDRFVFDEYRNKSEYCIK